MQDRVDQSREPWVSVDAVAKHLGVAKDTVYRWIESRGLPAHKVGRLWKARLGLVDQWVEAGGAAEAGAERDLRDLPRIGGPR